MYRIAYQGSKQAIVDKIFNIINNDLGNTDDLFATTKINKICDLFCGGGAVGYYFYIKGYNVVMNDFNKSLIDLHIKLQNKEISNDLLYKWIDRDEFNELIKRDDWYGALIRQCWSFGNAGENYLFRENIENYKKQGHDYVINFKNMDGFININSKKIKERYSYLIKISKLKTKEIYEKYPDIEIEYKKYLEILERKYTKEIMLKFTNWLRSTGITAKEVDILTQSQMSSHYLATKSQPAIPTIEQWGRLKISDKLKNIPRYILELFDVNGKYKKQQLQRLQQLERLEQLQHLQQLEQLQHLQRLEQLQRLQQLERLEQLERLQQLEHTIKFYSKNYWEIEIDNESIVYCDPPYVNSTEYLGHKFDFNKFDDWVREMKNKGIKVYISEYTNHNNEWREVGGIAKYSLMNNSQENKTLKYEKIFCNI